MPPHPPLEPRDIDRLYVFRVVDVLLGEGGESKPAQLFKWGVNAPVDGRSPVVVDDAWADQAEGAFARRTIDLAIDYNHASLFGFQDSPAAGWISALRIVRPGQETDGLTAGVWLLAEWTPEGRRRIRDREYRYMSAVLRRDYETGAALPELLGAALTNTPAIHGLEAVAASAQVPAASGVNESAGDGAEREGVTMDVLKEVGYASVEELKSALSELVQLREKAAKVEPLSAQLAEATKRVEAAEAAVKAAKVDAAVAEGRAAGRVTKDNEAFARKLAERDLEMFGEWLKAEPAKPVAPPAPAAPEGRLPLSLSPADGDDREALLKKAQAYAKEHRCSLGEAYEALAGQASN